MKTVFLAIIAAFLLSIPWIRGLDFDMENAVAADLISKSGVTVMALAVFSSMASWSALSWASKGIRPAGVLLSIITGASLVIPLIHVLGPVAGILVGVAAGFSAFMLQKKMADPARNRPVVIAAVTLAAAYLAMILLVLAAQSPYLWGEGDGIASWSGTAEGIEDSGFDDIFNNNIGFSYFLAVVPSLVATGLVLRRKSEG